MREEQLMRGDVSAEGPSSQGTRTLVVVTDAGPIAHTGLWIRREVEGQDLIAIPRLRVGHEPSLRICTGTGLGLLFADCRLITSEWEDVAGFVGGAWMLWRTGQSDLVNVGFVKGKPKFDIERAVRGITKLLRE